MNHCGTKEIETERLLLRKFKLSDAPAMYNNWASDPEVTKYLIWPPHLNIETTQNILKEWTSLYQNLDYYQWAITLKDDTSSPIGSIGVVDQNEDLSIVHIGYCIGKKWWHKGYTTEALKALINYFFTNVDVNRIESRHDTNNPNSGKVMKKCGMHYEGTLRQADRNNQGICDACYYSILKSDKLPYEN